MNEHLNGATIEVLEATLCEDCKISNMAEDACQTHLQDNQAVCVNCCKCAEHETDTATAKHYGQMIARDLELLDTIADLYNGSRGETWREMIAEHTDDNTERLALETFLESGNVFTLDDTAEDGEHPLEAWADDSLEIIETGTRSLGGAWESDGFKILITFGGPNCWLEITPRGNSVYTAWGSDSHREPVDVPTIEAWLDGIAEAY